MRRAVNSFVNLASETVARPKFPLGVPYGYTWCTQVGSEPMGGLSLGTH